MAIKSSGIEQEVIILKAAKELIDSMVNFELMSLEGNDPDSEIAFKSITHQRFFNIILVDFLSCTDPRGPIKQTSYLGGLSKIVGNPYFNENNSVHNLKVATQEFQDWLDQEVEVNVWLPSIDKETKLDIKRFNFLKMTGNVSKHNYLRAINVAKKLKRIFNDIYVVTDKPFLYQKTGINCLSDIFTERGPLGGIYTALELIDLNYIFVFACDMPFLSTQLINYMIEKIDKRYDAIVPLYKRQIEPLHAIYAQSSKDTIRDYIIQNRLSVHSLFSKFSTLYVKEKDIKAFGSNMFFNVNTTDDYKEALAINKGDGAKN